MVSRGITPPLPVQSIGEIRTDVDWALQERKLPASPPATTPDMGRSGRISHRPRYPQDQSYFLYDLPQEVLGRIVFPLELTKPDTRLEAARHGLRTAEKTGKPGSLPGRPPRIDAGVPGCLSAAAGEIVLSDGTVVGEHDGIEHFTIGQRKGSVAWRERLRHPP